MKILHIDKFLRREGGAAAYMLNVAEAQRSAGHDVEFFSMDDARNLPSTLQQHFPRNIQFDPIPPGALNKARAIGRMLWSAEAASGVKASVRQYRPDIVHLHTFYHQLSPSILHAIDRERIPMVMTVHDYKIVCPSYRMTANGQPCRACVGGSLFNPVIKKCKGDSRSEGAVLSAEAILHKFLGSYGKVARFICPSQFMYEVLIEGGVDPSKLVHVPHFVEPYPYLHPNSQSGDVLYAGRLSPEKGVDVLIDAVAGLDGVRLRIAGDGPLRVSLEERAARAAPDRITFLGQLSKEALLAEFDAASVAVAPSTWYENQPIAVLEAMASGTPSIVTSLGGAPELVVPGTTGLIVAPNDVQDLRDAIRDLAIDPSKAQRMGAAARKRATEHFDLAAHLRSLDEVYSTVVGRRSVG